jgi:hypothetical protein
MAPNCCNNPSVSRTTQSSTIPLSRGIDGAHSNAVVGQIELTQHLDAQLG